MHRLLVPILAALAACTPAPRKAAMPSPVPHDTVQQSSTAIPATRPADAATGPIPEPVSAAGIAAAPMPPSDTRPNTPIDTPAAALGRRTLSTAFVRIGPDAYLTVELHGGRVLVLRDVEMGANEYCGRQASGKRHCGAYADVAAARPGGAPVVGAADAGDGARARPKP